MLKRVINSLYHRIQLQKYQKRDIALKRKIVVIESDDWGSIRMPSKEVYDSLKPYFDFQRCNYCSNDSILTNGDLDRLGDVLLGIKNYNGKSPIITANFVTSNPDFKKILESDFKNYYSESIVKTIERYPDINFENLEKLLKNNILKPQLHGREHLNINRWLYLLKSNNKDFIKAFENDFFGLSTVVTKTNHRSVMAAFDSSIDELEPQYSDILDVAIEDFKKIFGFHSKSFIAPNYIWNNEIEQVLKKNNVNYIQGARCQYLPSRYKANNIYHYTGEKNDFNQIYLVRNVIFEPSSYIKTDLVDKCLKEIEINFNNGVPCIICTHRVNFSGRISLQNRDMTLNLLSSLFNSIVNRWPDVEFMSSDELGDLILFNGESR